MEIIVKMHKWDVRLDTWTELCGLVSNENHVYVYGSSGNGKTTIVKDCLYETNTPCLFINCIEIYLFNDILQRVNDCYLKEFLKVEDNLPDDAWNMTLKIDRNINKHKLFYVVLDKVDILIKNDMSSVHKLADIASLSKSNLKFILISRELATELFIQPKLIDRSFNPTPIVLQDYNEYQLASILRPEFELGSNEDYTAFVTIIYSLLHKYTTKIYHYRFVILNLYKNYLDTAYQLQNADDKLKILHKVIERELEDIDNTLYKRVPLFKDFQDGLSKEAKLLIIAGYICSHNHPKYDKTTLKGIRKTHKKRITKNVENTTLKPPEKFQLMRLQSVYTILYHLSYAQRATEVMQIPMETPSFCSLVNILVQKRFFKREGKNEALGNDRFRCLADLEWVKELAESMDIKLDELVIGLNTN